MVGKSAGRGGGRVATRKKAGKKAGKEAGEGMRRRQLSAQDDNCSDGRSPIQRRRGPCSSRLPTSAGPGSTIHPLRALQEASLFNGAVCLTTSMTTFSRPGTAPPARRQVSMAHRGGPPTLTSGIPHTLSVTALMKAAGTAGPKAWPLDIQQSRRMSTRPLPIQRPWLRTCISPSDMNATEQNMGLQGPFNPAVVDNGDLSQDQSPYLQSPQSPPLHNMTGGVGRPRTAPASTQSHGGRPNTAPPSTRPSALAAAQGHVPLHLPTFNTNYNVFSPLHRTSRHF